MSVCLLMLSEIREEDTGKPILSFVLKYLEVNNKLCQIVESPDAENANSKM